MREAGKALERPAAVADIRRAHLPELAPGRREAPIRVPQ
jgi:hypothetical protein